MGGARVCGRQGGGRERKGGADAARCWAADHSRGGPPPPPPPIHPSIRPSTPTHLLEEGVGASAEVVAGVVAAAHVGPEGVREGVS